MAASSLESTADEVFSGVSAGVAGRADGVVGCIRLARSLVMAAFIESTCASMALSEATSVPARLPEAMRSASPLAIMARTAGLASDCRGFGQLRSAEMMGHKRREHCGNLRLGPGQGDRPRRCRAGPAETGSARLAALLGSLRWVPRWEQGWACGLVPGSAFASYLH